MHLIKERRFIKSKIFAILGVFLIWLIADNILEFVFPLYLNSLNKSYIEIGILLSLASVSGIILDMPFGFLSDKTSRKKLMISGLFFFIISSILIFLLKGNIVLAAAFLFWGAAFQLWKVPFDAKFASLTKQSNRAKSYGLNTEVKYLGMFLGPLVGGFLILWFGFKGILGAYSLLVLVAILLIFIFIKETNQRKVLKEIPKSIKPSAFFSELKLIKKIGFLGVILLFFSLLFTIWEEILLAFGPLFYSDVLNISPGLGGILLACFSFPAIFLSYHFGKLADRFGKKLFLLLGLLLIGASLLIFSITKTLPLLFILALLVSTGLALALPSLSGLLIDFSYRDKKGEIIGIWDFFLDIGYVIGPIIGGILAQFFGIRGVFAITGVLFLLSPIFLLFKSKNKVYKNK